MSGMKPNVLFVNIPPRPTEDLINAIHNEKLMVSLEHEISMPMGILYLSSYIKKYSPVNHVEILDYVLYQKKINTFTALDDFIKGVAQSEVHIKPDLIAVSMNFSTSRQFTLDCVKTLKNLWPDSIIVIGGNHATNTFQDLLSHKEIDYVIRGEGEIPLSRLVSLMAEGSVTDIQGVISREKCMNGGVPEISEFVQDLDLIPFPDWDLIDMGVYTGVRGSTWDVGDSENLKVGCIISSRGCPNRCTYCSSHTVHGRKIRYRTVDNVVEEIKELYLRYGVNILIPWDDMWTANHNRSIELLRKIRSLNIPNLQIQYQNGLAVNALSFEIVDELVATGMVMAAIAVESGSEYTQKYLIKKNCNLNKAREMVAYMKSKGIFVRAFFILGFPDETKELMEETISYAIDLKADWSVFSIASPLIGSEMYTQFVQMGCIRDDPLFWGLSTYSNRSFDTPEITAEELNEVAYRANLECNFIHNPNFVSKEYGKALTLYRDVILKFPFHVVAWYCTMLCEQRMGNDNLAVSTRDHLNNLILTNPVANKMYVKYRDLMPDL